MILFGLGYLIKKWLDTKTKKTEINHNLFQQKKLDSTNLFFANYATVVQTWKDISINEILERKYSVEEFDHYIFPKVNELRRNVFELQIYYIEKEHDDFQLILRNMEKIFKCLYEQYYNYDKKVSIITKVNRFQFALDKILEENASIYIKIIKHIKVSFK